MLELKNVDLVAFNCLNPEQSVKALLYSSEQINFASVKLFSHYKPKNITSKIEYIEIPKFDHISLGGFIINQSNNYIHSDYMISIHADGFIINPNLWTDEFLKYDYIGAPWPPLEWCSKNRVGNDGFVLKSKKFRNIEQIIPFENNHIDVLITNTYHDLFKTYGCKYAPIEVAYKFSLEHEIPECEYNLNNTFGFHGKLTKQALDRIELLKKYD